MYLHSQGHAHVAVAETLEDLLTHWPHQLLAHTLLSKEQHEHPTVVAVALDALAPVVSAHSIVDLELLFQHKRNRQGKVPRLSSVATAHWVVLSDAALVLVN